MKKQTTKKVKEEKREDEIKKEYLTDAELTKYLKELHKTIYWQAIQQYNRSMEWFASSALRTIDPFKEPTQMARNQGKIDGVLSLEQYVNDLVTPIKEDDAPNYNN